MRHLFSSFEVRNDSQVSNISSNNFLRLVIARITIDHTTLISCESIVTFYQLRVQGADGTWTLYPMPMPISNFSCAAQLSDRLSYQAYFEIQLRQSILAGYSVTILHEPNSCQSTSKSSALFNTDRRALSKCILCTIITNPYRNREFH
jgi:hypothetical protein